jgi:catalase (peroxidase I)
MRWLEPRADGFRNWVKPAPSCRRRRCWSTGRTCSS